MLIPKRTKFRKYHRGRNWGKATSGNTLEFGDFGLQATSAGNLTERQIEAARRAISRHIKRGGKVWIRVFPDKSMTKLPAETRMGKGKGSPEFWVAPIQPGKIILEIGGIPKAIACEALTLARHKLPIDVKIREKIHIF